MPSNWYRSFFSGETNDEDQWLVIIEDQVRMRVRVSTACHSSIEPFFCFFFFFSGVWPAAVSSFLSFFSSPLSPTDRTCRSLSPFTRWFLFCNTCSLSSESDRLQPSGIWETHGQCQCVECQTRFSHLFVPRDHLLLDVDVAVDLI